MPEGIHRIAVRKAFDTEEACVAYLAAARWPKGVWCLKCEGDDVSSFVTNETVREITDDRGAVLKTARVPPRRLYQCANENCRHQFSVFSGTIFDKSHLPLSTWFQAVAILVNAKQSVSARHLQHDLGVTYRTAWFLKQRIREAMSEPGGAAEMRSAKTAGTGPRQ